MNQTIGQIIAASGNRFDQNKQDFDILLKALEDTGLLNTLDSDDETLTLLAPNDAAFVKFARKLGYTAQDESGAFDFIKASEAEFGGLTNLLQYHLTEGRKRLKPLKAEGVVQTLLTGETFEVRGNIIDDNEPDIANPRFVAGGIDIGASNGIVHTIDGVLFPLDIAGNEKDPGPTETIGDLIAASGGAFDDNRNDYDILGAALEATGLNIPLNDVDADFTAFAPSDSAFISFAKGLGFQGNSEQGAFEAITNTLSELGNGDPLPILTDLLNYHVSEGSKTLKVLREQETTSTLLEGETFDVKANQLVDNDPRTANPKFVTGQVNQNTVNGRVHGINRVLLPSEISGEGGTLVRGSVRIDRLVGSADNELMLGLAGADILLGKGGDDTLRGGLGNDKLRGGAGQNLLDGGAGNDRLFGGRGDETLIGGGGDDLIIAGGGFDTIVAGAGNDLIIGPIGDSAGGSIDGGRGKDEINLGSSDVSVVLRQGDGLDQLFGFEAGQTTFGLSGGLGFADLTIRQRGAFTQISTGNEQLINVFGATATEVNQEANFEVL